MTRPNVAMGAITAVGLILASASHSAGAAERPFARPGSVQSCDCAEPIGFGNGQRFGGGYGWGVGHGFGTGYGFGVGFGFNGGSAGGYAAGYRHRSQYFGESYRSR